MLGFGGAGPNFASEALGILTAVSMFDGGPHRATVPDALRTGSITAMCPSFSDYHPIKSLLRHLGHHCTPSTITLAGNDENPTEHVMKHWESDS